MTSSVITKMTCMALLAIALPCFASNVLRDPTQPYGVETKRIVQRSDIKLQAIFYNATKPTVLVGGRYYYQGDSLSGMIITKITSDTVFLQGISGEVEVSMYPTIRQSIENASSSDGAIKNKKAKPVSKANDA